MARGKDSTIRAFRSYTHDFICNYDMRLYPFDTQRCFVNLLMRYDLRDYVELVANELQMEGPRDLIQYVVKDVNIMEEKLESTNHTYLRVEV